MTRPSRSDAKAEALRAHGTLHPRPSAVTDPLFVGSDFFDPRDLLQVRYEMLRRVRVEGLPVARVARTYGVSRPTLYHFAALFESEGVPGLLPKRRGPRGPHKLTGIVWGFLEQALAATPSLKPGDLAALVKERFGTTVHPRSVERGLARRRKKAR